MNISSMSQANRKCPPLVGVSGSLTNTTVNAQVFTSACSTGEVLAESGASAVAPKSQLMVLLSAVHGLRGVYHKPWPLSINCACMRPEMCWASPEVNPYFSAAAVGA